MNYKVVKGQVGPWAEGTVITKAELDAYPGMGGTERLVDNLKVLEETKDKATSEQVDDQSEEERAKLATGHAKPDASTAGAPKNAPAKSDAKK